MTWLAVDTSVAVKWLIPDRDTEAALRWYRSGAVLCAPDLIHAEVGNALWKLAKLRSRQGMGMEAARRAMRAFAEVPIRVTLSRDLVRQALDVAALVGITVYDALYVVTAITRDCRLVTADRRLHEAVGRTGLSRYIAWVGDIPL